MGTMNYARRWGVRRSAWDKIRRVFLMINPTCSHCGGRASVVDHRTPHRGDMRLFWDPTNWQPMCVPCHGRKTVRRDGGFGNARA